MNSTKLRLKWKAVILSIFALHALWFIKALIDILGYASFFVDLLDPTNWMRKVIATLVGFPVWTYVILSLIGMSIWQYLNAQKRKARDAAVLAEERRFRESISRRERLGALRERLRNLSDRHLARYHEMNNIIATGSFAEPGLDNSRRMFLNARDDMREIRQDFAEAYAEMLQPIPDTEATPALDRNPFFGFVSGIDRFHTDAQKFEARRAYEQANRFQNTSEDCLREVDADFHRQTAAIRHP